MKEREKQTTRGYERNNRQMKKNEDDERKSGF